MGSWVAEVIGRMHVHKITQAELAEQVGVRRDHLNKVLNGKKNDEKIRDRIVVALDEMIAAKA